MNFSTLTATNFFSVNLLYTPSGATKAKKNRESAAIILKIEGETEYFSNGNRYVSNLSHPIFLPKGSDYTWNCLKGGYFFTVEFDCDQSDKNIYPLQTETPEKLLKSYRSLLLEKEKNLPTLRMKAIRFIYDSLYNLLSKPERVYTDSRKQKTAQTAAEYISSHLDQTIENHTLSNLTGVSVSYFRRIFKEVYGVSPIQYATDLKMKKAKELLKSDFYKIGDIATLTGYKNIYHFSKAFKQSVGVSPLEFSKTPYKN